MRIIKIIITCIICQISLSVSAQLKIGATGGVVLSSLVRDGQLNAREGKVGYLIGANARYSPGELGWFFESGISYTLEGDNDQNLNFVRLPLIIGLDVSEDVNINVAYYFAWQVGNQNNVQEFYKQNASILGLGFEMDVAKNFAVGSRLNYGLSNLVEIPYEAKNFKIRPFTLDLYLTYFILSN